MTTQVNGLPQYQRYLCRPFRLPTILTFGALSRFRDMTAEYWQTVQQPTSGTTKTNTRGDIVDRRYSLRPKFDYVEYSTASFEIPLNLPVPPCGSAFAPALLLKWAQTCIGIHTLALFRAMTGHRCTRFRWRGTTGARKRAMPCEGRLQKP